MESLLRVLQLLAIFVSIKTIETQCTAEDSCICHCQLPCSRTCSICAVGWSGTTDNYCQRKNVAYGVPAISTSIQTFQGGQGPAKNAVDEDPDTYSLTESEINPQLTVTLSDTFNIGHMFISLLIEGSSPYYIYVTNSTSPSLSDDMLCTALYGTIRPRNIYMHQVNVKCYNNGVLTGNQVVIMRDTYNGRLQVFDIKVYQCSVGTYGSLCEKECRNCQDNRCEGYTGVCLSDCNPGWYGDKCDKKCSSNCETSFCDSSIGCTSCMSGHHGPDCELCLGGTYGKNCSLACRNCQDCDPGLGCKECVDGFHGVDCSLPCPQGCRDDNCDRFSGHCRGGCKDGLFGTSCGTPCKVSFHNTNGQELDPAEPVPEKCSSYNVSGNGTILYTRTFLCTSSDNPYCCGEGGQQYCCSSRSSDTIFLAIFGVIAGLSVLIFIGFCVIRHMKSK